MRKLILQHTTPANRSVFHDLGFDEATELDRNSAPDGIAATVLERNER